MSSFYGIYRGRVLQNTYTNDSDPKIRSDQKLRGRCKVWVPSVFPEEYQDKPKYLPWAEPAYSPFGGCVETGINSVPAVGAIVWVFFESGSHMSPVYFLSTQGGDNWFAEHSKQHVIKTDSVEVIIDENPTATYNGENISSLSGITSYNNNCATGGDTTEDITTTVSLSANGPVNLIINGSANIKVTGKTYIEHEDDVHETIDGNLYRKITGNITEEIEGSVDREVTGTVNDTASTFNLEGETNITGETNIEGNTNVTGTVDATVDVVGGPTDVSLIGHTHTSTTPGSPTSPPL